MTSILYLGGSAVLRDALDPHLHGAAIDGVVSVVTPRVDDAFDDCLSVKQTIHAGGLCDRVGCYAEGVGLSHCSDGGCYAHEQWARLQVLSRSQRLDMIVVSADEQDTDEGPFEYASSPATTVGRVTSLLHHRWRSLRAGVPVVALGSSLEDCESLCGAVVEQAVAWRRPDDFLMWLKEGCSWVTGILSGSDLVSIAFGGETPNHPMFQTVSVD